MYCNDTDISQTQIKLEDNIYSCVNRSIAMSCPRSFENATIDDCLNKTMECDLKDPDDLIDLYCTNGTLIAKFDTACNSTTSLNNSLGDLTSTLECYFGSYIAKLSSFIPTTSTEAPITTTTEKLFSLESRIHMFLLNLIGKSEVYETTTEPLIDNNDLRLGSKYREEYWMPEALTLPPDFVVPDKEYPFYLWYKVSSTNDDGSEFVNQHPVEQSIEKEWLRLHLEYGVPLPAFVTKIPKEITENLSKESFK